MSSPAHKWIAGFYLAWALAVFSLVYAKDGLTPDNITHLGIAAYLAASFVAVPMLRWLAERFPARVVFIGACCVSAMVVETCYMISAPLHPSLLVDARTGTARALRNLAIDLALTLPAYVAIFAVIWMLCRVAYSAVEVAIVISAGQALGDGMAFLIARPQMLLFLPYLMLNYQAMTLVPFVALRARMPPAPRRPIWLRVLLPLAAPAARVRHRRDCHRCGRQGVRTHLGTWPDESGPTSV